MKSPQSSGNKNVKHDENICNSNSKTNRLLLNTCLVYYCSFIENLGRSVIRVLVPLYIEQFHASPLQLGILFSAHALMSSLSAMCMGPLSDKYGRRNLIIFGMCGTMVGFASQGFARNYYQFLACRIFTGAFDNKNTIVCMCAKLFDD